MESEKVVVALLLITIILSIVSVIVTFSINSDEGALNVNYNPIRSDPDDTAVVKLIIEKPAGGTE